MATELSKPTSNERILATLAHFAALVQGLGLLLPAFLWAEQRKDSRFVAFQTLQAYAFQSLGYTVWLLFSLALGLLAFFVFMLVNLFASFSRETLSIVFFFFALIVFLLFSVYAILAVVAAVVCAFGRDFRYPYLGDKLAKYISYASADTPQDQTHEERFAVAMGHFAVIFPFYGLLGPLGIWLTEGKRSMFIRFQSAQTVIYQIVGSILYAGIHLLALVFFFPLWLAAVSASQPGSDGFTMLTLSLAFVGLCVLAIATLLGPLYHILGQWAGLQILLGRDYRYPLIGRLTARWLKI